jgi:hypothetical protein
MLKEIKISIDDLLLDPNNPRFISSLDLPARVSDDKIQSAQGTILARFSKNPQASDPDYDVTNIRSLYDSMLRIGFVGIDRVVVRAIPNSKKYLVLEGNRRIATVKTILADSTAKKLKPEEFNAVKIHKETFELIPAIELETEGISQGDIDHQISQLLGVRHHGSLLEWEPLPKAFNIYCEYLAEDDNSVQFEFSNKKIAEVASRLCITRTQVTGALKTYVAYTQLRNHFSEVQASHYSLIEAGVMDGRLSKIYFKIDPKSFQLDEESLTKFNALCQFATRDSKNPDLTTEGKKKILPTPKHFGRFGKLIDKQQGAHATAEVYAFISDKIHRVEDEGNLDMTIDRATNEITDFENSKKWAEAVEKLFAIQKAELPLAKYSGEGSDRGQKDALKATMEKLRGLMRL